MTDIEELYTDYGSASIANMDDIDELYIDTCSTSMDDMVEHHDDDIDPTMYTADAPTYPYLANGATYEDRGPPDGTIIWIIKSVPNIFGIDTLLRAPQGAIMRVPMHKIIDITDIIWSIKSAPNMSHHLGMARTVIDSHHLMIVVDHHHLMVYIDILPHMIFDDTTQDMVMRQEHESLDMKATPTSCATTTMAPTSSYAYGLRCYKCKQQGHLPRECPNLLCEVCKAKGHVAWQCTTPSAKKLYFDELNAQVSKMPPLEDDLGGDGVEHGEHGILPSPTEAHGVEMVEHGKFPSTKEAHGDEQVEPTPTCLIDELVPTPCSTEDEFPLMEKMYMVHEDDDISPCLLQDGHVDHMDPPTSTTPTSHESAYKATRTTTSTATEHELTKRAIESYPIKDLTRESHQRVPTSTRTKREGTPWCKEEGRRRKEEEEKEEEEEEEEQASQRPPARRSGKTQSQPVDHEPAHPIDNRASSEATGRRCDISGLAGRPDLRPDPRPQADRPPRTGSVGFGPPTCTFSTHVALYAYIRPQLAPIAG
ncbi:hypothetical protein QYE76_031642 [Lolium multiflorum]|uniref:CCHC-type domain-containing protein n=1 Tax=Lolium multiflorum TaxID=4521 RepID=A0AAD8VIM8_LOLMU|nr:hypothetical protein QYE76_031642 [Lolium multiflorum]